MSTKHTPGPWTVRSAQTYRWEVDADRQTVARITTPSKGGADVGTANARLIAAAPELLAALDFARGFVGDRGTPADLAIADAVIKKARGGK